MNKSTIVSIMAFTAAAFTAQGCSDAASPLDGEGSPEQASEALSLTTTASPPTHEGDVVASFTTRAGSAVTFLSSPEDELGVGVIGTIGKDDPELAEARRAAGGDAVALYQRLAGAPAPAALRDAAERASRPSFLTEPPDQRAGDSATGGFGLAAPSRPAAAGGICNITNWAFSGSNPFVTCWPNQHSTPWEKRKADHLSCRIDAVQGGIRAWYKYWTAGGSHKPIDAWLSAGQYLEWTGYYVYARRYRECKTVENPNAKTLHFRVAGHEYMSPLPFNPVSVTFP
jgi:hypothetical protein